VGKRGERDKSTRYSHLGSGGGGKGKKRGRRRGPFDLTACAGGSEASKGGGRGRQVHFVLNPESGEREEGSIIPYQG